MRIDEIYEKVRRSEKDTEFILSVLNRMLKDSDINKTKRSDYAREIIDYFKGSGKNEK